MSRPPATPSDAAQLNAPVQRETRLSLEKAGPTPTAGTAGARSGASATREITIRLSVFDQRHYRRLIEAREETIRRVVRKLKPALQLQSSVDAGCGVGFFAATLAQCGLSVRGFDARNENVAEARKRFPNIRFDVGDAEDREIRRFGKFDLTLCCGLLYHLENPLMAIRNLRAITGKCLLLESMCLPEERMEMLLREEPLQEDQSVLRGAEKLLTGAYRPVVLAELQDTRTRPWGYAAREIVKHLTARNYEWFALTPGGGLVPASCEGEKYDANLVAIPAERVQELAHLLAR